MKRERRPKKPKRRIGVLEHVAIPEWGLYNVQARIDTGASTSSIDVSAVQVFSPGFGALPRAVITVDDGEGTRTVSVPVAGFRKVRNPSGHVSNRPIVEAVIVLRGRRFRTPINLHPRKGMTYRMIIGRRALMGRFVVDVDRE
ncbi:MAG TPA: RimK/LysX family protein [Planctomycetota bacterium]|nr:RimK/LysX family protein [Planctomycetota bacterium]